MHAMSMSHVHLKRSPLSLGDGDSQWMCPFNHRTPRRSIDLTQVGPYCCQPWQLAPRCGASGIVLRPCSGPVGGLLIEAGDLEFGHPLRRRRIRRVQERRGGREPVDRCERFAVHSHRQECGAVIGQCTDRGRAINPSRSGREPYRRQCSVVLGEVRGRIASGRIADELRRRMDTQVSVMWCSSRAGQRRPSSG